MDNRRGSIDSVGAGTGEQLHHGRDDSYPAGQFPSEAQKCVVESLSCKQNGNNRLNRCHPPNSASPEGRAGLFSFNGSAQPGNS